MGEYYSANNTQDDLGVIAGKLTYRTDDHAESISAATPLVMSNLTEVLSTTLDNDPRSLFPANKGVLERNSDVDCFSFFTGNGPIDLAINPAVMTTGNRGANVDLSVELRDAAGSLLLTNNALASTAAEVRTNLAAGRYFLVIRSSGVGSPLSSPPSGYTGYGGIGKYYITGSVSAATELRTARHPTPLTWLAAQGYTNDFENAVDAIGANGMPLWQSYIAGLTPTNRQSQLRLGWTRQGEGVVLDWNPIAGRSYTVLSSSNAATGFVALPGASNLTASVNSFTHVSGRGVPRFYRLGVKLDE
jgi:hypothetical protein